ncbi:MAG: hypothetical protein P8Y97_08330 [Candidatus Lokiarchaeota archaeon]
MIDKKIRANYPLFLSGIIMLVYSILEIGDCIIFTFMIVGILPNFYLMIGQLTFPEMQYLMEYQPLVLLPIFLMFTLMRFVSSIGLLKNRKWGYFLSLINVILTMLFMIYLLPISAIEGFVCAILLILLLIGRYKKESIIEN